MPVVAQPFTQPLPPLVSVRVEINPSEENWLKKNYLSVIERNLVDQVNVFARFNNIFRKVVISHIRPEKWLCTPRPSM